MAGYTCQTKMQFCTIKKFLKNNRTFIRCMEIIKIESCLYNVTISIFLRLCNNG